MPRMSSTGLSGQGAMTGEGLEYCNTDWNNRDIYDQINYLSIYFSFVFKKQNM